MTRYPVQCFEHNGEPYGRYVNRIKVDYDILTFNVPGWLSDDIERKSEEFEAFADENTFPMPCSDIGKTYERGEVEVVLQYFAEWNGSEEWFDCDREWFDAISRKSVCPTRRIFRLVISKTETATQPVEKELKTDNKPKALFTEEDIREAWSYASKEARQRYYGDNINCDEWIAETVLEKAISEKEPETVEQAARIESLHNSYNNRVSKEISTGDAISTLDEANGYNKGFNDGWKSAIDWQKKQEAYR